MGTSTKTFELLSQVKRPLEKHMEMNLYFYIFFLKRNLISFLVELLDLYKQEEKWSYVGHCNDRVVS